MELARQRWKIRRNCCKIMESWKSSCRARWTFPSFFWYSYSALIQITEQPIRLIPLTDRVLWQFYIFCWPKRHWPGVTSTNGVERTATATAIDAHQWPRHWCVRGLYSKGFPATWEFLNSSHFDGWNSQCNCRWFVNISLLNTTFPHALSTLLWKNPAIHYSLSSLR